MNAGVSRRALLKATPVAVGGIVLGVPTFAAAAAPACGGVHPYADGVVPMSDGNIRYRGRWQQQASGSVYGYFESGLEFGFTGTSLAVALESTCRLLYSVDGGEFQRNIDASGTLTLASGLDYGLHTAVIYSDYQQSFPKIEYLQIDHGAGVARRPEKPTMEVIGDSISVGWIGSGLVNSLGSSYSFKTPELLGFSHDTIAFGGIAMAPGSGSPDSTGMLNRYTKLSEYVPGESNVPTWGTSQYVPDYVVINLGTNDPSTGTAAPNFKPAYLSFLENLRSYYPDAVIFALSPFNTAHRGEISDTVSTRNAAGDSNVTFIDTTGWIDVATETTDGTHPTIAAHEKIAADLAAVIRDYLAARH
jgi:hypothetical protein